MKIEDQVCSQKQAQEFKKLGFAEESYFIWAKTTKGWRIFRRGEIKYGQILNAYSLAELDYIISQAQNLYSEPESDINMLIGVLQDMQEWKLNNYNAPQAHRESQLLIFTLQENPGLISKLKL